MAKERTNIPPNFPIAYPASLHHNYLNVCTYLRARPAVAC